jgi:thiamine biosynthesis lipoprotein
VVDRVRKKLLESGVSSALIDLDRDIATIGKQTDGSNWMLAVRHPRGSRTAIARIKLNDGAIAIRGDFERCLQLNGERFGRALNPADGRPIPGLLSVAVTAASCVEACSAATLARMKDEADALPWLVELGLPWMGIDRNLECHGPLTPATAY